MESISKSNQTSFEIGPKYETRAKRLLRSALAIVALTVIWLVVSFVTEEFVPFFRTEAPFTREWWNRTLFVGVFWSIAMVFSSVLKARRRHYSLTIERDRITKLWKNGTYFVDRSVIEHSDFLGVEEVRTLGRLRGFVLKSKYQTLFVPVGHPQYSEIKGKIEEWLAHNS